MRDLYKHLGIDETASKAEVRFAISQSQKKSLRYDASTVLLNSNRRRVFNRSNLCLHRIGKLRANLGLVEAPNWSEGNNSDYRYSSRRKKSVYESFISNNITSNNSDKGTTSQPAVQEFKSISKIAVAVLAIILIIVFVINDNEIKSSDTTLQKEDSKSVTNTRAPEFNIPVKPLPVNGYTHNYTNNKTIAPFEIQTPSSSNLHYFVKLEDYISGELKFIIFIRAGHSVTVEVPLGTYKMKYATGETWYGRKYLFGLGERTRRFKAEDILDFRIQDDQVSGYTVELILQEHGNLTTNPISVDEW